MGAAFSEFLQRLAVSKGQWTTAADHRQSVETALKSRLDIRAMWETGSFHHGTGVRFRSDIDVLVSLIADRPTSSDTALDWVQDALNAGFPRTAIYRRRPAIVVDFAGGQERWECIPGFITGRGGPGVLVYDIPGAASGWMDTSPGSHLQYVNDSNSDPHPAGGAKSLARLLKAWKYYCNVPVSSFYLEMRAAQHMRTTTSFWPVWDTCRILEKMKEHDLADMNDPTSAASSRFAACSSVPKRTEALSKLSTASTRARSALNMEIAGNETGAFHNLDLLFGEQFPSRVY